MRHKEASMIIKSGLIALLLALMINAAAFAAQVEETDDIDSFLEDEKVEKTYESSGQKAGADKKIPHKIFSLGLGFNFGVFISDDMEDINRHIYNKVVEDDYLSTITFGDAKMYLNMVPRFTINVMPVRYFMIQFLGEVGWGPKVVMSFGSDSQTFHFLRYSPGIVLNGYIPIGETGTYSFFLGGGAFYHFFEFESFEAQGFGGRGQLGFRIDWKTIGLEIFAAYDYARAETGDYDAYIGRKMTLDYSSVLIGLNLYFKII